MTSDYFVGDLIYDPSVYDSMNTQVDDLEFYKRWLPENKDALILELCCGTGRLTLPIAQEGYTIAGLDYTSSMLEQAREKAAQASLDIRFVEGDMRNFDLRENFDLIFIPFNSIHHLYTNADVFQALDAVKKHLKPQGLFILDCFNPDLNFLIAQEKEVKEVAQFSTADGRNILVKQNMRYERATQINRIAWHYFIDGEFDSIQNLDMRMFFPQELDSYLHHGGFSIKHKFGNFDEAAFTNHSDKQIFVCQ